MRAEGSIVIAYVVDSSFVNIVLLYYSRFYVAVVIEMFQCFVITVCRSQQMQCKVDIFLKLAYGSDTYMDCHIRYFNLDNLQDILYMQPVKYLLLLCSISIL